MYLRPVSTISKIAKSEPLLEISKNLIFGKTTFKNNQIHEKKPF